MNRLFFSGRSLQQALLAAARHLQIPPEEIAYSLRERQGGFIKNPRIVIEVDPSSPRRPAATTPQQVPVPRPPAAGASHHAPAGRSARETRPALREPRPRQPQPSLGPESLPVAAAEAATLLARLAGLEVTAEVSGDPAQGELEIRLEGPAAPRVAANQGELLEPLEHLTARVLRGMTGQTLLCRVDAAGFRAAREAELRRLALEAAETVRRDGRPHALPEMSPAERRIVHLALEQDPSVTTASHGDGFLKSVTVSPA